ncbi:hypothetical protein [Nitratireductor sp.]|uniref:hypothetical protein n=1 Tax=Nitratireductor sp. TaxID=1872084 RepID=UPI0026089BDC|nr:hypothetical protein [Nitratireductor sp.]
MKVTHASDVNPLVQAVKASAGLALDPEWRGAWETNSENCEIEIQEREEDEERLEITEREIIFLRNGDHGVASCFAVSMDLDGDAVRLAATCGTDSPLRWDLAILLSLSTSKEELTLRSRFCDPQACELETESSKLFNRCDK